ncbi:MAG: uracil-DNA glycosylase [Lactobacillaceae bacterium]|jgi:uracil-DNA glycosylase|nr:uracil-DNA glycosylase [Lactobacillaceae bacterium]
MEAIEKFRKTDWGNEISIGTDLENLINSEYQTNTVFPKKENLFKAFELTPLNQTKVVILGQDPYHEFGQAQGLSFSVPNDLKAPPSLRNIQKELVDDLGIVHQNDLTPWAKQGVLLLNTALTVIESKANSHQGMFWEDFTKQVIELLSQKGNVVFVLWGKNAQSYRRFVDDNKNYIISSAHPSPLSAYRGFFGSRPFSKVNSYLDHPIDWSL